MGWGGQPASPNNPFWAECGPNLVETVPHLVASEPMLVEICQFRTKSGRTWSKVGQSWANFSRLRAHVRQSMPKFGQISGQIWPNSSEFGRDRVVFGQFQAMCGSGPNSAELHRIRRTIGRFRLARTRPNSANYGLMQAKCGPASTRFGRSRPDLGRIRQAFRKCPRPVCRNANRARPKPKTARKGQPRKEKSEPPERSATPPPSRSRSSMCNTSRHDLKTASLDSSSVRVESCLNATIR